VNHARLLFGSILLAAGAVLVLGAAGVLDSGEVIANWWPLALVATALVMYAATPRHWVTPTIVGVVGGMLLLETLDLVDNAGELVLPVVVIGAGLALLVGRRRPTVVEGDRITAFAAFSGTEVASHSKHFEGGNIGAVFGGAEVDLRDAELAPGASLEVFTAFGGTEVKVPEGWKVVTHGLPLFGGFENITTKEILAPDAPVLDVTATVLFGGLEVRH
jgi:hypothetical protein